MTASTTTQRRPADRKRQLGEVAAELFLRHGYLGVGVNDIAGAAGITGPALYRHFPSKQALLAYVLRDGLDQVHETVASTLDDKTQPAAERLAAFTAGLARVAVDQRGASALWRWEGRHLTRTGHVEVLDSAGNVMSRWSDVLGQARGELSGTDAELLCWAAMSVFGSVAVHRASIPRRTCARLLAELAEAVLAVRLPGSPRHPEATPPTLAPPPEEPTAEPHKREELLAAATSLFRRHGFRAVSVEEIGQAAGLAAASVYRHFPSKDGMLLAACYRMTDRLTEDAKTAIDAAADEAAALHRLIESYVDAAADNRDLIAVYSTDIPSLPPQEQADLRTVQREYVARWVDLCLSLRPDGKPRHVRATVHAALTIVNDLVRTGRTWQRPNLRAELAAMVRAVLAAQIPDIAGTGHSGMSTVEGDMG